MKKLNLFFIHVNLYMLSKDTLSYISGLLSTKDLCSFSLTCKDAHNVCIPHFILLKKHISIINYGVMDLKPEYIMRHGFTLMQTAINHGHSSRVIKIQFYCNFDKRKIINNHDKCYSDCFSMMCHLFTIFNITANDREFLNFMFYKSCEMGNDALIRFIHNKFGLLHQNKCIRKIRHGITLAGANKRYSIVRWLKQTFMVELGIY